MEIAELPNDSFLTNIGSLSRKSGYEGWLITVIYLKSTGEKNMKGVKFSNAPILCRGRKYSNSTDMNNKGSVFEFTINELETWVTSEIFYASYFESLTAITLSSTNNCNISAKCYIPQLELARVLFFYNTYLSTSALQERALDLSFRTSFIDGSHVVEVLPHCTLSTKDFKDNVFRSLLAWLLLNDEARQSYNSIHNHLMQEKKKNGNYEKWIFTFTPPPLKNVKIKARFYIIQGNYRINEIISITNLASSISKDVVFTGEHFVDNTCSINPLATEITTEPQSDNNSHIIDDTSEANIDKTKQIIFTSQVALAFHDPIKTDVFYKRTRSSKGPKITDNQGLDKESVSNIVATDEATIFGNVAKGDFRNVKDISDQSVNNAKDFEAVTQLLTCFKVKHTINLVLNYHELPKVKHCRRHRTKDGRPRLMMEARFQYANQNFSVFEVYTADINTRLSTLIVKVDTYRELEHKMSEFMISIVKGSISWKGVAELLIDYETTNHPVGFYDKECDKNMLRKWLSVLEGKLIVLQSIRST